ncbi:ALG3 [Candida pseudojiufengensis]|uniref:ALG3 n=1 Tax=Candida pseudojiufengensis TaxID=497109 RepID=UPI002225543F|nr:ALG3 [Candida pseudojiufengensis]KAI5963184.1 ALG3 [Candida pseudojiufengensis]
MNYQDHISYHHFKQLLRYFVQNSQIKTHQNSMPPPPTKPNTSHDQKPKLTFKNVLQDIYEAILGLISSPEVSRFTYPIITCLSSIITKLVIGNIKYTEIDYTTYLQQIDKINQGEINYSKIYGDSGPIVYPAGFVIIYQHLQWLCGDSLVEAQKIFGYIFTTTILFVSFIYSQIWDIQPWTIWLLLGSKRLVSIYVLRLFNDVFTTLAILGVVILLQQAAVLKEVQVKKVRNVKTGKIRDKVLGSSWYDLSFLLSFIACDLYSLALSIKMNALLYLPALVIIIYFLNDENLYKFIILLTVIPLVQIMIGWKFLVLMFNTEEAREIRWNYLKQSFNFSRSFLYKWTVNWKFIPENIFLSSDFSSALLVLHSSVLLFFIFTRFLNHKIIGKSILQTIKDFFKLKSTISENNIFLNKLIAPQIIFYIISLTNLIGVLFSRSLHYQFLSWYAWSLPALLQLNFKWYIGVPLWFLHEWCWNVFPATSVSSAILISELSIILALSWYNFDSWFPSPTTLKEYTNVQLIFLDFHTPDTGSELKSIHMTKSILYSVSAVFRVPKNLAIQHNFLINLQQTIRALKTPL